jgi:hypothetical protein
MITFFFDKLFILSLPSDFAPFVISNIHPINMATDIINNINLKIKITRYGISAMY